MRTPAVVLAIASIALVSASANVASVGSQKLSTSVSSYGKQLSTVAGLPNARIGAGAEVVAQSKSLLPGQLQSQLKMVGLFLVWYSFNSGYNVFNAWVKKVFTFPWATSALQLLVGMIYAVPLWASGVRKVPKLTKDDILKILPIAMLNAAGHASAVVAMFEKGGGSFTHVIKASEPVVSVILFAILKGVLPKPLTAVSLLPITYGVAYASTLGQLDVKTMSKEMTTKAARMAMTSNVAFALRSILRKDLPSDFKTRTNLDPQNEHGVTTLLSFLLTVPFVLAFESLPAMWDQITGMSSPLVFVRDLVACGMCFYLYNEMQNIVLGSLGPVTTAVGNTLKRVFIFLALYLFTEGETFPPAKVLGCVIAVLGCLAYAIFDAKKI